MNVFFLTVIILAVLSASRSKVKAEVICYQCVSTQPGCGTPFDWSYQPTISCPNKDDKCVKIIETKGADEVITRNCLSLVSYSRRDVPADTYEGCRPAAKDHQLAHYVQNSMKELDIRRDYYDRVNWCFCNFDNYCNTTDCRALPSKCLTLILISTAVIIFKYYLY